MKKTDRETFQVSRPLFHVKTVDVPTMLSRADIVIFVYCRYPICRTILPVQVPRTDDTYAGTDKRIGSEVDGIVFFQIVHFQRRHQSLRFYI